MRLGKMAGDEGDYVLPAKFWEFHQTRVHRLFLACLLRYFRANQEYEKLGGGMGGDEASSLKLSEYVLSPSFMIVGMRSCISVSCSYLPFQK